MDDNRDGDEDEEDEAAYLMECLIKNKNHQDMPKKCKVGIEHHQLVGGGGRIFGGLMIFKEVGLEVVFSVFFYGWG